MTSKYQSKLSGEVAFTTQHVFAQNQVLLVELCRDYTVGNWVGTHSMCTTVVCEVTGCTATMTHIDNSLGVGRQVLLGLYNCCVLHISLGLCRIGISAAVKQNIASAWTA